MHLHVGDIDEALAFYRDVLGFEVQANLGSAAFVSAGGYHHHLGFNIWSGRRGRRRPAGAHGRPAPLDGRSCPTPRTSTDVRERTRGGAGPRSSEIDGGFVVRDPWQRSRRPRGTEPSR